MNFIKNVIAIMALIFSINAIAADPVEIDYENQRLDVRHRLFKTKNTWNFLQLDTQTGQVWQVQYSVKDDTNRVKIPIVKDPLISNGKVGRFTLYPTKNTYNFLLLDQDTGKSWQVQWSLENNLGFWSIEAETPKLEWKR